MEQEVEQLHHHHHYNSDNVTTTPFSIEAHQPGDDKLNTELRRTVAAVEELLAERPLSDSRLKSYLNKVYKVVSHLEREAERIQDEADQAREKAMTLLQHCLAAFDDQREERAAVAATVAEEEEMTLRVVLANSQPTPEPESHPLPLVVPKTIEDPSSREPEVDQALEVLNTAENTPPRTPLLDDPFARQPYWFSYAEVQHRIAHGFAFLENNRREGITTRDIDEVGYLITHLSKSRHVLRFLQRRPEDDDKLLVYLLRSIHTRTVKLMPPAVKERWLAIPETAQEEEEDEEEKLQKKDGQNPPPNPDIWGPRLKRLQDFLCQQQVFLFGERVGQVADPQLYSTMVRAGNAVLEEEQDPDQCAPKVPFSRVDTFELQEGCPYCLLPGHLQVSDCDLRELILCFNCFQNGHARKHCKRTEILPQDLIFFHT